MNFTDAQLAALAADTVSLGVFFRLETVPVVRIWLGFGAIKPGVNTYDAAGEQYLGFGEILDIPNFSLLLNGAAERVEFTLSGVSGDVFAVAAGSSPEQVKGKILRVGFALLDATWSPIGAINWHVSYRADFLSLQRKSSTDPAAPITRKLALSCGTMFTGRRRPANSYFTDVDQQARYPGDAFCDLASKYAHNFAIAWPVY